VKSMVKMADLTIILGSPASGKTTLARRLSVDLTLPVLCKDDVKEALFDVLGSNDREWSRLLSEASFAALARLARTQLAVGQSSIVEGNWRAAHAPALGAIVAAYGARTAQICCRAEPQEIVRRFTLRKRHAGHMDQLLPEGDVAAAAAQGSEFMDLGGLRLDYRSDSPEAYGELLRALKSWRL
jgi:predicted kinase